MAEPLHGRRALILVDDQVEDTELLFPKYALEDAGVEVRVAGKEQRLFKGKRGYEVKADLTTAEAAERTWDLVVVPGGFAPDKLRANQDVLRIVREQDRQGKPLAAICHAGWVLASAGVAKGRKLTSYWTIRDDLVNAGAQWVDEKVVVDRNLVTSRHPPDLPAFTRALLEQLRAPRREPAEARAR